MCGREGLPGDPQIEAIHQEMCKSVELFAESVEMRKDTIFGCVPNIIPERYSDDIIKSFY